MPTTQHRVAYNTARSSRRQCWDVETPVAKIPVTWLQWTANKKCLLSDLRFAALWQKWWKSKYASRQVQASSRSVSKTDSSCILVLWLYVSFVELQESMDLIKFEINIWPVRRCLDKENTEGRKFKTKRFLGIHEAVGICILT